MDANTLFTAVGKLNFDIAAPYNGLFQLRGLVAFGQVWIKVVLPLEGGLAGNLCVDGEAKHDRIIDRLLVEHGQSAGHGEINGAGLGVGFCSKSGAGAREYFSFGG